MMKIIKNKKDLQTFLNVLKKRALGSSQKIEQRVKAILDDVRENGNRAVLKYNRAFDSLKVKELKI